MLQKFPYYTQSCSIIPLIMHLEFCMLNVLLDYLFCILGLLDVVGVLLEYIDL